MSYEEEFDRFLNSREVEKIFDAIRSFARLDYPVQHPDTPRQRHEDDTGDKSTEDA